MANELTLKIIDIEDTIALYKMGLINEQHCLDKIQLVLRGGEPGNIEFNAGEELTDIKFVGDGK